jgi:hypothetical protein
MNSRVKLREFLEKPAFPRAGSTSAEWKSIIPEKGRNRLGGGI